MTLYRLYCGGSKIRQRFRLKWLSYIIAFTRDAVIIGFIANELISIVENAGLMGVPLPGVVKKAIDILTAKMEAHDGGAEN